MELLKDELDLKIKTLAEDLKMIKIESKWKDLSDIEYYQWSYTETGENRRWNREKGMIIRDDFITLKLTTNNESLRIPIQVVYKTRNPDDSENEAEDEKEDVVTVRTQPRCPNLLNLTREVRKQICDVFVKIVNICYKGSKIQMDKHVLVHQFNIMWGIQ